MNMALKIPPPIVFVAALSCMYGIYKFSPRWEVDNNIAVVIGSTLFSLGVLIAIIATWSLRKHHTTVDPRHPEKSEQLVTTHVYRLTRNPMYLCLVLWLVSWAIFLRSPLSLIVVTIFIIYITHFQIKPEEQALTEKFGHAYLQYLNKVRRWI